MIDMKQVQKSLKERGFDPGPIDGIAGPITRAAIIAFKKSIGYRATSWVGPLTKAALFRDQIDKLRGLPEAVVKDDSPPWLKLAMTYLGLREYQGARHNSQILSWWQRLGLSFRDDETPWCAGFLNGVLDEAGFKIPHKYRAAALGWRWTGFGVELSGPCVGAIMSMRRAKPGSGHIGFVVGKDKQERIMLLGGNQGNAVSINPYHPTRRYALYHWPEGAGFPDKTGMDCLPVINATGRMLVNEA